MVVTYISTQNWLLFTLNPLSFEITIIGINDHLIPKGKLDESHVEVFKL